MVRGVLGGSGTVYDRLTDVENRRSETSNRTSHQMKSMGNRRIFTG